MGTRRTTFHQPPSMPLSPEDVELAIACIRKTVPELTEAQVRTLLDGVQRRRYRARSVMVDAGTEPDYLLLILDGLALVEHILDDGSGYPQHILFPGNLHGRLAHGEALELRVVALSRRVVACLLPHTALLEAATPNEDALFRLICVGYARAHDEYERRVKRVTEPVVVRLADLLTVVYPFAENGVITIPQTTLAGLIDASRDAVNEALRELEAENVIRRRPHRPEITVPDAEALGIAARDMARRIGSARST